jgi:hypothetical protein
MQSQPQTFTASSFLYGIAVGFLAGFSSGYFLDRIREWRTKRKDRSRDIFEPLYAQLSEARTQITNFERPDALNYDFWHQLNQPRRIVAIPPALQQPLREFYSDIVPNYEASWIAVNEHGVEQILTPWTLKLGTAPDLSNIQRFPKYYRFLTSPEFRPALLEIQTPGIIPLWNKTTDQERLKGSGLTVDQFFKQVWDEAQAFPTFQALRNSRQTALRVLSEMIPLVRENIVE